MPDTPQPLQAVLRAEVFEFGGRPVVKSLKLPVRNRPLYLGIRPAFANDAVAESSEAGFEVVAVDPAGSRVARQAQVPAGPRGLGLSVVLPQQRLGLRGRRARRRQHHRRGRARHRCAGPHRRAGAVGAVPARGLSIRQRGRRQLPVQCRLGGRAGRWATRRTGCKWSPTRRATRRATSPGAASRRRSPARRWSPSPPTSVVETRSLTVPAGGTTIDMPVKAEWGAGAYALVTAWRPLASAARARRRPRDRRDLARHRSRPADLEGRDRCAREGDAAPAHRGAARRRRRPAARRPTSRSPRSTRASCSSPTSRRRSRPTSTSASASSASRCATTTAACSTPRPASSARSAPAATPATSAASAVPTRTVALFSGPVKLDDKGEARIALDIPDFIGQLRLMAVACDQDKVGSADARHDRARCGGGRRDPAALPGARRPAPAWRCRCTTSRARPATTRSRSRRRAGRARDGRSPRPAPRRQPARAADHGR